MIDPRLKPYLTFDYDNFVWAAEDETMEMVRKDQKITSIVEMTQEYFDELVWLLVAQMDSEYVGAYGYMPITYIAPSFAAHELKDVPAIVHDEFTHGNRIRGILNDVGFDADHWVEDRQSEYSFRIRSDGKLKELEKEKGGRLTEDFRVDIFYYDLVPISSRPEVNQLIAWINFGIFQFFQDRGAGEQLRDTLESSFGPWAEVNRRTISEENKHIHHGDTWMAKLFKECPELVQQQFDLWWPRTLATFGKPESKRNDLWRKLGLKRRTNEEVVREFLDRGERPVGLNIANEEVGLKIPSTQETLEMWREGRHLEYI